MMLQLRNVYTASGEPFEGSVRFLYKLLKERPLEASISHAKMPTLEQHARFVRRRPYRAWYIATVETNVLVGAVLATRQNEIGVAILRAHQRKGHAQAAIIALMKKVRPLGGVAAIRRGAWIANVAPGNRQSRKLFEKLGGRITQLTYVLPNRRRR